MSDPFGSRVDSGDSVNTDNSPLRRVETETIRQWMRHHPRTLFGALVTMVVTVLSSIATLLGFYLHPSSA